MPKTDSTSRHDRLQRIGDKLKSEQFKARQKVGNHLADLMDSQELPHLVAEGIKNYVCEIVSVVPLWTPRILRMIYPILCEEAEKNGVDLTEPNYVGQELQAYDERHVN